MASKNNPNRGKGIEPPQDVKPRYMAMATWTPRALRGVNNGKRGKR